ncbi:MAG: hypothetical protein GWN07_26605, partial [Actinobacteria bacterium]|nr:hypothetical protein [Actinomycetota bacterium]NIU68969.1 hypothetical protein [Actinomycetota bacterium]NIW30821.1 hypothetical protein [Actinomycetota bacterium]NIX23207.1 hypothetical protein [Actinomycetota bacterium]
MSTIEIKPADEPLDVGDVVLEAGVHLGGVVLDHEGQPVEGAEVVVEEAGGGMTFAMAGLAGSAGEPDAVTDPGGWFQVVDLDAD